jgi:multicomponent Na+:H+ antiporter subunit C
MLFAYAVATGAVAAAGVYMMLERNVFRVVLGLAMLATAANLVIFLAGGIGPVDPAIITSGNDVLAEAASNPLPQALVLTAIVIGFALIALAAVLAYQTYSALGTLDGDAMTAAEEDGSPFDASGTSASDQEGRA